MDKQSILNMIQEELKQRMDALYEEEKDKMILSIEKRMQEELASLSMSLLQRYDVYTDRGEIVIRVERGNK